MGMVFEKKLDDPKTVGALVEFLKGVPPETEVLSLVGPVDLEVWRDEVIGERRVEIRPGG